MKNLLNSTDIATLFLDKKLNILRFTNQATKIFKLIKSDIGRPFTDQVSELIYPELAEDALEVLRTLIFTQKQISTKNGRWFSVRIMPYRTFDDRINGLVITFINISALKKMENDLQQTMQMHRLLFNSSSNVIIKLSVDWKIVDFNREAEIFFGKKREEAINQNYIQLFIPQLVQKKTEIEMNKLLLETSEGKLKMQVMAAGGNMPVVEWSVNITFNNLKMANGMILVSKNNTA
jgi:two-component system CheB/CheR fusion protein